jgi:hypothetical protein
MLFARDDGTLVLVSSSVTNRGHLVLAPSIRRRAKLKAIGAILKTPPPGVNPFE